MKNVNFHYTNKKKARGARRKCVSMARRIEMITEEFPMVEDDNEYWHFLLPIGHKLIGSSKLPNYVRKKCIQTLLERAEHLVKIKPKTMSEARVFVQINLTDFRLSGIMVYYDEKYFRDYFIRNNCFQKWIQLSSDRSLASELGIKVPDGFKEKGYFEECHYKFFTRNCELWFFGELFN